MAKRRVKKAVDAVAEPKRKKKRVKAKRKAARKRSVAKTKSLPIKGVPIMAKKRRKARAVSKKIRRRGGGNPGGGGIQKTIINGVLMGGGAIAGALVASKMLPAGMDKKLKAIIPVAAGLGLHQFVKNEMVHNVGYGMMALGVLFLAKEFMPNMVTLSGEDEIFVPQLPGTYQTMGENEFGADESFLGIPESFGEDLEVLGVPESFGEDNLELDWRRKE